MCVESEAQGARVRDRATPVCSPEDRATGTPLRPQDGPAEYGHRRGPKRTGRVP